MRTKIKFAALMLSVLLAFSVVLTACGKDNNALGDFALTTPANNAIDIGLTPNITWSASANAEWYEVTLSAKSDYSQPLIDAADTENTFYQVLGNVALSYNTKYYIKVTAFTSTASKSATSVFTTEEYVEPGEVVVEDVVVVDFASYAMREDLIEEWKNHPTAGTPSGSGTLDYEIVNVSHADFNGKGLKMQTENDWQWHEMNYLPLDSDKLAWTNRTGLTMYFKTECEAGKVTLQLETQSYTYFAVEINIDKTFEGILSIPFSSFVYTGEGTSVLNTAAIRRIDFVFNPSSEETVITIGSIRAVKKDNMTDNRNLWEAAPKGKQILDDGDLLMDFGGYTSSTISSAFTRFDGGNIIATLDSYGDDKPAVRLTTENNWNYFQTRHTLEAPADMAETQGLRLYFDLVEEREIEFEIRLYSASNDYSIFGYVLDKSNGGELILPFEELTKNQWASNHADLSNITHIVFHLKPLPSGSGNAASIILGNIAVYKGELEGNINNWISSGTSEPEINGDALVDFAGFADETALRNAFVNNGDADAMTVNLVDVNDGKGMKLTGPSDWDNGWTQVEHTFSEAVDFYEYKGIGFYLDSTFDGGETFYINIVKAGEYTNYYTIEFKLNIAESGFLSLPFSAFEPGEWGWEEEYFYWQNTAIAIGVNGLNKNVTIGNIILLKDSDVKDTRAAWSGKKPVTPAESIAILDFSTFTDTDALANAFEVDPSAAAVEYTLVDFDGGKGAQIKTAWGAPYYGQAIHTLESALDLSGGKGIEFKIGHGGSGDDKFMVKLHDGDGRVYEAVIYLRDYASGSTVTLDFSSFSDKSWMGDLDLATISKIEFAMSPNQSDTVTVGNIYLAI